MEFPTYNLIQRLHKSLCNILKSLLSQSLEQVMLIAQQQNILLSIYFNEWQRLIWVSSNCCAHAEIILISRRALRRFFWNPFLKYPIFHARPFHLVYLQFSIKSLWSFMGVGDQDKFFVMFFKIKFVWQPIDQSFHRIWIQNTRILKKEQCQSTLWKPLATCWHVNDPSFDP